MSKYFESPKTLEELKVQFRKLALKFHPDCGGSNEEMKEINAEYEKLFNLIKSGLTEEESKTCFHNLDDGFREQVIKIMFLPDIIIELVGSWLWISGKTFQVSPQLREAGFTFSKSRKMWYWKTGENKNKVRRASKEKFEIIKARYGSETIEKGRQYSLGVA